MNLEKWPGGRDDENSERAPLQQVPDEGTASNGVKSTLTTDLIQCEKSDTTEGEKIGWMSK
jgi:hypothetical protein